MSTTLRMSDILARSVAVEWFEAVAIVSEVSDRVRESLGGQRIPELDQVQLTAGGAVTLTGATKTDEPVRRLGQLLQAGLVQSDPPVQLRLVVSQATAPEPGFSSIREFSEALAYFERPDRTAVLRNLVARAQAAPPVEAPMAATLDEVAPLPAPETKKRAEVRRHAARRQPSRRAVLALAATVLLIVAATAYSQLSTAAPTGADVSALAIKASDAVGTTLVKGISAVSETVGLGRFVPAEGSGAPAPAAKAPETPKRVTPAKGTAKPGDAPATLRIFDLAGTPAVGVPVPAPMPVPDTVVTLIAQEGIEAPTDAVYSAADEEVSAPIGVRPQLPRVLPGDVRPDQLSQIELIILPDGSVGSVKLLSERGGVLEGMLLSAAKAWKFLPALKDGKPVTYRKSVWLALND